MTEDDISQKYIRLLHDGVDVFLKPAALELKKFLTMSLSNQNHNYNIFFCGNGGSASTAEHATADFGPVLSRFGKNLKCFSLNSNTSSITCIANDEGYDYIFERQIELLSNPNDLIVVFSGSGNSTNIINVLKYSKQNSIKSFSLLGFDGGAAKSLSDFSFIFPIHDMQVVENLQLCTIHLALKFLITAS